MGDNTLPWGHVNIQIPEISIGVLAKISSLQLEWVGLKNTLTWLSGVWWYMLIIILLMSFVWMFFQYCTKQYGPASWVMMFTCMGIQSRGTPTFLCIIFNHYLVDRRSRNRRRSRSRRRWRSRRSRSCLVLPDTRGHTARQLSHS